MALYCINRHPTSVKMEMNYNYAARKLFDITAFIYLYEFTKYATLPAYLLNLFWFGYDYYVSIITNVFYVTTLQKPWAGLISF